MSKIQFRLLKPSEIEVRRSYAKKDGDNLYLLFIDSRSVVKLLDETVGAMNWQTDFYEVNGQMFGKLGIWDDDKNQWVWKSDVGSETNIEAQKGAVSDCYKRLLARWGVTELYTAPKIRIDNPNKYTNYYVSSISYTDDRCICALQLVDKFGNQPKAMEQAGIVYATDQMIDLYANGITNIHVYSMNKPWLAEKIRDNLSAILEV